MAKKFLSTLQQQAIWMLGIDGTRAVTQKNVRSAIFRGIGLDDTGRLAKDQLRTGDRRTLQPGRCYLFDGVDDIVLLGSVADLKFAADFTICGWFKTTSTATGNDNCVVGNKLTGSFEQAGYHIAANNAVTFVRIGDGTNTAVANAPAKTDGQWHHFAAVRTTATLKMFVDGVEAASVDSSAVGDTSGSSAIALGGLTGGFHIFNGSIFDIRFFDTALTANQIAAIYAKNEETQNYPTPVAWYKCDEGDRIAAFDSSGNGHHGTKTNVNYLTFNAVDKTVPRSFQNDTGHTLTGSSSILTGWNAAGTEPPTVSQNGNLRIATWSAQTGNGYAASRAQGDGYATTLNDMNTWEATVWASRNLTAGESMRLTITGIADLYYVDFTSSTNLLTAQRVISYIGLNSVGSGTNQFVLYKNFAGAFSSPITFYIQDAEVHRPAKYRYIPRNESDPSKDVLGNALQYSGPAPRDAKLIKSHCATFDGVNDFVDAGTMTANDWTFCVWQKHVADSRSIAYIAGIAGTAGVYCQYKAQGDAWGFYDGTTVLLNGALPSNTWNHLAVTKTGTSYEFFVDGKSLGTQTGANVPVEKITLGRRVDNNLPLPFAGSIADARIYSTALSATDIAKIANGESITAAPVGHWPLAEGAGTTAFDVSGNGRHGTVKNANLATFWGTTQDNYHRNIASGFDHVLEFDGVDDQVVTTLTTPHPTLAGWFFVPAGTSQTVGQYMFAKAGVGGIAFGHGTAEYRGGFFYIGGSIHGPGPITLPTGRWFHYLLTFTGTQILAYLDGVLVGSKAVTGSLATNANAWVVNGEGSVARMPGRMRDVRIYNQAVSASDAAILAAGDEIGLSPVLHLPLNEGSGTTAFDQAGSNNGTITGATWTKQPASTKNVSLVGSNLPVDRPAGSWHNGAETHIDFTNGEPNQPWTNELTVPTDYAYGDSLTPPVEKKVNPKTESEFYFFNP